MPTPDRAERWQVVCRCYPKGKSMSDVQLPAITITRDSITFSSGRSFYIHAGIIGLGLDLNVTYGYDGDIRAWPEEWRDDDDHLTAQDRRELADYMIALWTEFRDAEGPKDDET